MDEKTHEAMIRPKKGDRFHDCYCHWVYVVKTSFFHVWVMSSSAPCVFPEDATLMKLTRRKFIKKYAYGDHMKNEYSIKLADRGNDVEGWV